MNTSFVGINRNALTRLQWRAWDKVNPLPMRNSVCRFSDVKNYKETIGEKFCDGFCASCERKEDSICQSVIDAKVAEYLGIEITENTFSNKRFFEYFVKVYHRLFKKAMKKNPDALKAFIQSVIDTQVEETEKAKASIRPAYEKEVLRMVNENKYDGKTYAELYNIDGVHCQACDCPNYREGKCHRISDIYDCNLYTECMRAVVQIADYTKNGYTVEYLRERAKRVDEEMYNFYTEGRYCGD